MHACLIPVACIIEVATKTILAHKLCTVLKSQSKLSTSRKFTLRYTGVEMYRNIGNVSELFSLLSGGTLLYRCLRQRESVVVHLANG